MGRFDALKDNTFSSSEGTTSRDTVDRRARNNDKSNDRASGGSNRNKNGRNKANNKEKQKDGEKDTIHPNKELVDNSNNHVMETKLKNVIIKKDDFPELPPLPPPPPPTQPTQPPQPTPVKESCWVQAIKKREEEDKKNADLINQSDPKYWRGANWIGPMLIRQKQFPNSWHPNSWHPYVGSDTTATESDTSEKNQASSFIFPHGDTEYSRNGTRWYKSWEETFSSEQLFRIKYEEDETELYEMANNINEYYTQLEKESDRYFEEYGKLDDLAIAKLDRMEYEQYAEQFLYEEEYDEHDEDVDTEYISD